MDVIVKEASGIESDTIVSIRAGSTRRQGRLILDQPFCFPNLLVNASPFNVDLLRNVASAKLNVSPDVEDYEVIFPQNWSDWFYVNDTATEGGSKTMWPEVEEPNACWHCC